MVKSMVCRTIDDLFERVAGNHVRVVDEDGPEVNKDEETEVEIAMEGKHEDYNVVRYRLEVAVNRMESMRREGCRDNPLVVGLVNCLVDKRMVEAAVNKIYSDVSDEQKAEMTR
jgi:hypothetical protein